MKLRINSPRPGLLFAMMVILCMSWSLVVTAQVKQNALIYLTSGSFVRGKLIEYQAGDYVIIHLADGHGLRIEDRMIRKLKFHSKGLGNYTLPKPGYFNHTELGLIFSKSNQFSVVEPMTSIHNVFGYRLKSGYAIGLGAGIDRYGPVTAFPVYGSFRADFGDGKIQHGARAAIGYSAMWESSAYDSWQEYDRTRGGMYWEIGGGLRINSARRSVTIDLVYKHQRSILLRSSDLWWGPGPGNSSQTIQEKRSFKNLALKMGIEI